MKTKQTGLGGRARQSPDTAPGRAGGEDRILLLLLFLFSTATGFAQSGIATQWVRIPTDPASTPVTRSDHAMAYDERRVVVVFRCGVDSSPRSLADNWEWDGTKWTLVAEGNCMARTDCVRSGRFPDGANLDDAWEYGLPPLQLSVSAPQADGSLKIQWTGEAPPYQLQSRTNLNEGDWQDEGAPTDQTSATVQPTGNVRVFRVLSLFDNTP